MRQLFSILSDSFLIWARSFPLVYGVLLFLLLLGAVLPLAGRPESELRWLLLIGVVILLTGAFLAGWLNMVAQACVRFLEKPPAERLNPAYALEAFALFKEFFPGVGRFFPSVAVVVAIQALVLFLLALQVHPLLEANLPLMERVAAEGRQNPLVLQTLPPAEYEAVLTLTGALLLAVFAYALFSLFTMLWPAFILYYGDNAVKAYWRSFLQFLRDPLRLLLISGLFMMVHFTLNLLMALSGPLVGILFHFLALMSQIYFAVVIFVYAYQVVGKPTVPDAQPAVGPTPGEPPVA